MRIKIGTAQEAFVALRIHRHAERVFSKEFSVENYSHAGVNEPDAGSWAIESVQVGVKGWIMLGRGCSRAAWLSPTGNTYKIEIVNCYRRRQGYNDAEYTKYRNNRNLANRNRKYRIPHMNLYSPTGVDVLAVETIHGSPYYYYDDDRDLLKFCDYLGMYDLHPWNALKTDNGKIVVIDF